MIFNEIDKANIVKNKINLEKRVEYVYSSGEGDSFDHKNRDDLGVDSPGTYGSEPVSGISSKNVKYVNSESLDGVHIGRLHIEAESIDTFGDDAVDEVFKTVTLDDIDYNYRISNDKNKNYNFDVKRIKKKYLARDLDTEKIKSVKRIQEYYNTRHSKHNYKKMNWGFTNYNSLNMFTAGVFNDNINENSAYKQTHRNCLIYPNPYRISERKNQYDFSSIEEKTFSFYVNPNQKNIQNHNGTIFGFNAGCVLFIPGIISINVIKGSSRDGAGFVDKFRILAQLGTYSYDNIDYTDIESSEEQVSINDDSSQNNYIKTAVSKDNILSFNNWHNVCITLKKVENRNYILQFFVDGKLTDTFLENIDFNNLDVGDYITIGNKPKFIGSGSEFNFNYYAQSALNTIFETKYFSQNLYGNDLEGSYSKKQISFSKENESLYSTSLISNLNHIERTFFDSSLYGRNDPENILRNTNGESFAFHGEIHDIRILNISCDEILAKEIYENSVKEINESFDLEDLIFYVPFYYVPISVKKKGLVNLKKTGSDIELQDIAYSFPTNPYYFNYAGGHETSVENFVVEFVKGVSPNIVLEDSTTSDDYSILKLLSSNNLKEYSQKGLDPLEGCIKEASNNSDFWTSTNNKDLIYRNNMIFPNDNGIQEQNIEFALKHFFEETYQSKVFEEFTNYYNPTFVFTKNYIENNNFINKFFEEDFLRNDTLNFVQSSEDLSISFAGKNTNINYSQIDQFYTPLSPPNANAFRQSVLDSYLPKDVFNQRVDKLWNISNRNFHNNLENYENNEDYMITHYQRQSASNFFVKIQILTDIRFGFLSQQERDTVLNKKVIFNIQPVYMSIQEESDKFKTYSNPCSRLYESEISLNSEDNKKIDTKIRLDGSGQENVASINYYQYNMPLYVTDYDETNYDTVLFSISSQLVNKGIKKQTLEIKDVDLYGSGGKLKCTLKDNNFGQIYRSNCLTKVAKWNCIGNILYSEGFVNINHPGLYNFGFSNFKISFESSTNIYTHELNIPAYSGQFNVSNNSSYIEDLRLDNSSFNLDEDFVYITDINIHDENLNVLAKARLARPFGKKNSDNVLFRLKMDY